MRWTLPNWKNSRPPSTILYFNYWFILIPWTFKWSFKWNFNKVHGISWNTEANHSCAILYHIVARHGLNLNPHLAPPPASHRACHWWTLVGIPCFQGGPVGKGFTMGFTLGSFFNESRPRSQFVSFEQELNCSFNTIQKIRLENSCWRPAVIMSWGSKFAANCISVLDWEIALNQH